MFFIHIVVRSSYFPVHVYKVTEQPIKKQYGWSSGYAMNSRFLFTAMSRVRSPDAAVFFLLIFYLSHNDSTCF